MNDSLIKKITGMKADSIDNLSANFEKLGITIRKEIKKEIISKRGPWVSLLFVFVDNDDESCFRLMLASFKNSEGMYTRQSYFNIKTKEEAYKICKALIEIFKLDFKEG